MTNPLEADRSAQQADPSNPLYWNGKIWPNITRLNDAKDALERKRQVEEYLARGGKITNVEEGVATGVKPLKRRAGRKGGRKAEPINTGDKKFDMYLNALPEPVRVLVVPLGWDPRELYKEYRQLKRDGLIAKYVTTENQQRAGVRPADAGVV